MSGVGRPSINDPVVAVNLTVLRCHVRSPTVSMSLFDVHSQPAEAGQVAARLD
jgi:hypothetical protein